MASERVQRRIDRLLDEAEAAADGGDWQAVHDAADRVLAVDGGNQDALSFIAMAERGSGVGANTVSTPTASTDSTESTGGDAPSSFANGRYEVTGFLGEGGKKKVYLCHDTTLDRDVAFGLIKADGLDDESRQRITREAQAMARLGDHPNLMPIHDMGQENGLPYLVQPYMPGGSVEDLIEGAEGESLSLERSLEVAQQVLSGLQFAHEKGIIHRDLKPGNVWLTEDGMVRIGDFGLALSIDRSRLTQEKMIVGTVSYMPPEQATGGEVTPRSDLYSLGAMLYEMVTGRPPFMGDDEIAIIGQHINTPPVAPSWHNQSLPKTLDSLIMRLLSKDPAERPDSATDVLSALEAIDVSEQPVPDPDASGEGPDASTSGSLDSMAGGVFVGRHREMDQLKATFEDTLGGHGKMVALVGEPGIGKTRTAQELATYASMRGGQVLWGRCYEGGGAPPYWPWVQAIRSYVIDRDAETVRREMGSTASVIAEIVPDVKERLPDLQPPPLIDDPESARFRLFDSITTFLKTASSAQPIVLMLEDLHWSDKPSLLLLEFVARELGNSRLMIVGNYRDMELNRRHPLSITLGELTREHLFDRVLLRGLQKHDVHRFIEVAAGIDPPSGLVDVVHTQTEGNPLFVTETVRLLIQEGDITSGAKTRGGTSSWEIRIPEGVREVIGRRLDRLSERCNEVLATAAVIGRQFRFGVLMKLVENASENMLLDVLDEALDARIVEEVPSEVGLYQFAHALMQETLTSELSANRTVRLHARIAEALEDFYGDEADDHAAELLEHFAEAEVVLGSEKVFHYSRRAGEVALTLLAFDDALAYFTKAMESKEGAANGKEAAIAMWGLGRAQSAVLPRSERNTAVRTLRSAADYFLSNELIELAISVADTEMVPINSATGTGTNISELLASVLPRVTDSAARCRLLSRYAGAISIERGDFDSALSAADESLSLSRELNDPELETVALRHLGTVYFQGAKWRELAALMPESIQAATNTNSKVDLVRVLFHQVVLEGRFGDSTSVTRASEMFLDEARALKDVNNFEQALGFAISVANLVGDWARAKTCLAELRNLYPDGTFALAPEAHLKVMTGDQERVLKIVDAVLTMELPMQLVVIIPLATDVLELPDSRDSLIEVSDRVARGILENDRASEMYKEFARHSLALSAAQRGNADECANSLKQIEDADYHMVQFAGVHSGRIKARLLQRLNRLDEAHNEYSQVETLLRDASFRPELVCLCRDFSEMLLERDAPGDREKATELQDEAIAIATELGMKPLLERVLAQREILKA